MATASPPQGASRARRTSNWPRYDAATLGFRHYWYPVMWSKDLGRQPVALRLLGDPIMLLRERGKVYAFYDQCPHRGIPLSVGRQDFPGTWSCRYHGWVFDLQTGALKAALTDGPDSPICGKVRARTYPVAERAGLVWVYGGTDTPPPVEDDVPEQFLVPDAVVCGRITVQRGNWRYAAENSFDAGHANYLHRNGAVHSFFRKMPAWSLPTVTPDEGGWITVQRHALGLEAEYPGLGSYPPRQFWRRIRTRNRLSIRLPGIVRLKYEGYKHYSFLWLEPVDAQHYRLLQFYVTQARGLEALRFRLNYALYIKPFHHIQFNNQDTWMVSLMPESAPERLYRPDVSITAWRKLCEQARGEPPAAAPLESPQGERETTGPAAVPTR
ncbi:MAG TPA: Rieske 2Fe-2S domain-containing protein [Chloroflexota bacterium]|nr:Rieske 2Fe-2S domain-containing protein [Chloroflexota bacterium]